MAVDTKRKVSKIKLNLVIKVAHDENVSTSQLLIDFTAKNQMIFADGQLTKILSTNSNITFQSIS